MRVLFHGSAVRRRRLRLGTADQLVGIEERAAGAGFNAERLGVTLAMIGTRLRFSIRSLNARVLIRL
jgi:hypothetical protein